MTKMRMRTFWRTIEVYEVAGITNETEEKILAFCGGECFGGRVVRHGDGKATVEVYTD